MSEPNDPEQLRERMRELGRASGRARRARKNKPLSVRGFVRRRFQSDLEKTWEELSQTVYGMKLLASTDVQLADNTAPASHVQNSPELIVAELTELGLLVRTNEEAGVDSSSVLDSSALANGPEERTFSAATDTRKDGSEAVGGGGSPENAGVPTFPHTRAGGQSLS